MLYPNTTTCILNATVSTREKIDKDLLKKAILIVVENNEILRIKLDFQKGEPKQYVYNYDCKKINFINLSNKGIDKEKWLKSVVESPMEIYNSSLAEFYIFQNYSEMGYVIKIHHIICDGIGLNILINEISEVYTSLKKNLVIVNEKRSYLEYLRTEEEYIKSHRYNKDKEFWSSKYNSLPDFTELKTHNPIFTSTIGDRIIQELKPSLTQGLKLFCEKNNIGIFTLFLSSLSIYLNKVTHKTDMVIGTNYANRTLRDEKEIIGMFASTIGIRIIIDENEETISLLKRVSKEQISVLRHQKYPYNHLINDIRQMHIIPKLDRLFGISLVYRPEYFTKMDGKKIQAYQNFSGNESNDILINVIDKIDEGTLKLQIDYRNRLFESKQIVKMIKHIILITENLIAFPNEKIKNISLLNEEETSSLIQMINNTSREYPKDKTVLELFEEQVKKTPDNQALVFKNNHVTYRELNELSNQLAWRLRKTGVCSNKLVGVISYHSIEMIIGILAILKTGAAYVPIDPNYPTERIEYILEDAGIEHILICDDIIIEEKKYKKYILNPEDWEGEDNRNLNSKLSSDELVYVIYTSGSTGNPKGVLVTNRGLTNYIWWAREYYLNGETSTFPLYSSISFDLTITSIFLPLVTGNTIIIYENKVKDFLLTDIVQDPRINIIKLTPSHLHILNQIKVLKNTNIRKLIVGGENLSTSLANSILEQVPSQVKIFNEYGPTETVVGCMIHLFDSTKDTGQFAPIGKPISNTSIYLLDKSMNPVSIGVEGEIYIAGDGIARGYLNQRTLTSEKFLENPVSPGTKIYKTGDLAKISEKGKFEYIGRVDDQVKIRGHRIELGEIQSVIQNVRGVKDVVVSTKVNIENIPQLCAHYTTDIDISITKIREELEQFLPDFMIPTYFLKVPAIPLTVNGKVDFKELPTPICNLEPETEYIAPVTFLENKIVKVWESVLGIKNIGVKNHFFELGGDSLKIIQVFSRLIEEGMTITIKDLFTYPTVEKLSNFMEKNKGFSSKKGNKLYASKEEIGVVKDKIKKKMLIKRDIKNKIKQNKELTKFPLSFNQEALWLVEQFEGKNTKYNIPRNLIFEGEFSETAFNYALNQLVKRHDILRTKFVLEGSTPKQVIMPYKPFIVESDYITLLGDPDEQKIKSLIENEAKHLFNIEEGPLYYFKLFKISSQKYLVCLYFHHIIFDGWSGTITLNEIGLFYDNYLQGINDLVEPLDIQYSDYSYWQKKIWYPSSEFNQKINYWKNHLEGPYSSAILPYDRKPSFETSDKGTILVRKIPQYLVDELKSISVKNNTSLYITLLTAYKILLHCYSNNLDISVGTPVANRSLAQTQKLIGYFSNSLVLRTRFSENMSIERCISSVRDTVFDAFEQQEMPFGKLVELLNPDRSTALTPFFQTWFVYDVKSNEELPGLKHTEILWGHSGKSKWDITLNLIDEYQGIAAVVEYKTDLFEFSTIKNFLYDYSLILDFITKDITQDLGVVQKKWTEESNEYRKSLFIESKNKKKMMLTKLKK